MKVPLNISLDKYKELITENTYQSNKILLSTKYFDV
jgi:hypothetical protein